MTARCRFRSEGARPHFAPTATLASHRREPAALRHSRPVLDDFEPIVIGVGARLCIYAWGCGTGRYFKRHRTPHHRPRVATLNALGRQRDTPTAHSNSIPNHMNTLTLAEAAGFLKMHPEEVRCRAKRGVIPASKPGRRWVFIDEDLAAFLRGKYATDRQALRVTSEKGRTPWVSANEARSGGSISRHIRRASTTKC